MPTKAALAMSSMKSIFNTKKITNHPKKALQSGINGSNSEMNSLSRGLRKFKIQSTGALNSYLTLEKNPRLPKLSKRKPTRKWKRSKRSSPNHRLKSMRISRNQALKHLTNTQNPLITRLANGKIQLIIKPPKPHQMYIIVLRKG